MNKRNILRIATGILFGLVTSVSAQISLNGPAGFGGGVLATSDTEVLASSATANQNAGTIFVYKKSGSDWQQAGEIAAPENLGHFGQTMFLHGSSLFVYAETAEGTRGVLLEMTRDASGNWVEKTRLTPSGAQDGDKFGTSVAANGNWLLIGSSSHNEKAGAVYVFEKGSNGAWMEKAMLTGDGVEAGDGFGVAVAMNDKYALVGSQKGAHLVRTSDWKQEALLVGDDVTGDNFNTRGGFGVSLALLDGYAVVGAPLANNFQGALYTFMRDPDAGSWKQLSKTSADAEAGQGLLGFRLMTQGDQIVLAAPMTGQMKGGVFQYSLGADGTMTQTSSIVPESLEQGDFFAGALSVNGSTAVAGAMGANFGLGRVHMFARGADGNWSETGMFAGKAVTMENVTGEQVDCKDGEAASFQCSDVDLVSFIPVNELGAKPGVKVNDIWGWTDSDTGKEYALVGRMDGTSFVDVSNPTNPVYLGDLPMTEGSNAAIWRDIKVYMDHAYIVADGAGAHGMQVFDLKQLRGLQEFPVTFEATAHYDKINSAHNIVINEGTGFGYAVGASAGGETCGGGLHMIDLRTPAEPAFAGCFADKETGRASTGYSHDAQCIVYNGPDADYVGKEICFGANETALSIADVSDKENPVALSSAPYPNVAYSHQGWITDDHKYFFLNDELDELGGNVSKTRTMIWDVTDLDDPQLVKEYLQPEASSDHNLYIKGNYMYQSNYVSGLQIFDISDPTNPVRSGYFDTVKGENAPGFDGSWSNYPFFKSGVIAFTSMSEGLFLVRHRTVDI